MKESIEKTETYKTISDKVDEVQHIVSNLRCPICGYKVFIPNQQLVEAFGGNNGNDLQVWCMDMGHWIGFMSECNSC